MLYWFCLYAPTTRQHLLRESTNVVFERTARSYITIFLRWNDGQAVFILRDESRFYGFFFFLFFSSLFLFHRFLSGLEDEKPLFMRLGGRRETNKKRFTRCWPSLWSCPSWPCSRNSLWPWLVVPVLARRTRDTGCPICAPVSWQRIRNIDWKHRRNITIDKGITLYLQVQNIKLSKKGKKIQIIISKHRKKEQIRTGRLLIGRSPRWRSSRCAPPCPNRNNWYYSWDNAYGRTTFARYPSEWSLGWKLWNEL